MLGLPTLKAPVCPKWRLLLWRRRKHRASLPFGDFFHPFIGETCRDHLRPALCPVCVLRCGSLRLEGPVHESRKPPSQLEPSRRAPETVTKTTTLNPTPCRTLAIGTLKGDSQTGSPLNPKPELGIWDRLEGSSGGLGKGRISEDSWGVEEGTFKGTLQGTS